MVSASFAPNVYVKGWGTAVGPREGKGPYGSFFDMVEQDDKLGQDSFELAESGFQQKAIQAALTCAKVSVQDIDCITGGDLLNQLFASNFAARTLGVPFLGLYGACSTMAESLIVGGMMVSGGFAKQVICIASSHFSSAERQYRTPLEMGGQRPPVSQWTVTGSGATVLSNTPKESEACMRLSRMTIGRVQDLGITDTNNMGAAMAPAAADTITRHFEDMKLPGSYYDYVITGDLGMHGRELLIELLQESGLIIDSDRLLDCGCEIFAGDKGVACGGSGCGCSAVMLNGYYLRQMAARQTARILLVGTGALLSPASSQQGESVPGIAHAVALEVQ